MLREQTAGEQRELLGRAEVEMSPEGQAAVKQGELRSVGGRRRAFQVESTVFAKAQRHEEAQFICIPLRRTGVKRCTSVTE